MYGYQINSRGLDRNEKISLFKMLIVVLKLLRHSSVRTDYISNLLLKLYEL